MRVLLSGDLDLLDFDDQEARAAGRVRAALEKTGTLIGSYDLLIAGQALRRGLTGVTNRPAPSHPAMLRPAGRLAG
jgi:tRNA(fMet)-specific endonuclease VapC